MITIKLLLAVLCGGKLADKLRFVFSQTSDSNGNLVVSKFDDFLRQCFALTKAVGEEPTFQYRAGLAESIFPSVSRQEKLHVDIHAQL